MISETFNTAGLILMAVMVMVGMVVGVFWIINPPRT